jgi:sugar lactone lactonase YvrE
LNQPYDIVVDKERDRLIICDSVNKRVVQWPRLYGKSGETIISNVNCWGLTMDEYGSLYVVDWLLWHAKRYKFDGTQGTVIAGGNGQGSRLNQFNHPHYIFVDQDYSAYVSEWGNNRAMKWPETEGSGIVAAGNAGDGNDLRQLSIPKGLTVDKSGTVYVVDSGNNRIMR